jgi:Lipocalin-like domain
MPRTALSSSLVGTWRLESRTDRARSGERRIEPSLGEDPIALLYYDRSGHFAAQFMKRVRGGTEADAAAVGANNTRAIGGYDAYFGTYTVDDETGTVTQTLLGALARENVGHVVTRGMRVDGDTLTIAVDTTTGGEPVTRTLIWTRVG